MSGPSDPGRPDDGDEDINSHINRGINRDSDIDGGSGEILPRSGPAEGDADRISVGRFRPGSLSTQLALGRYLVGRVIIARINAGLMLTALVIIGIAVLVWLVGPHWLGILIGLLALPVLLVRALVRSFIGRITDAHTFGPAEDQVRRMIGDTGGDFRRELRRIGVPASIVSFPLLLMRLMRSSSRRTLLDRMRNFDLTRVVPASRVDELQMLITSIRRS